MSFRARLAALLALLALGLSFVHSSEWARERSDSSENLCAPNCQDIRFLAREVNRDDGIRVLRDDATYGNLRLSVGTVPPGTSKTYRTAFAVSNEEPFAVALNGVTLAGQSAEWATLTLHRSSNRLASADVPPALVVWDGPGADSAGVPHYFTWTLGAGDMNMATAGDLGEYGVAGPDPASNTR